MSDQEIINEFNKLLEKKWSKEEYQVIKRLSNHIISYKRFISKSIKNDINYLLHITNNIKNEYDIMKHIHDDKKES